MAWLQCTARACFCSHLRCASSGPQWKSVTRSASKGGEGAALPLPPPPPPPAAGGTRAPARHSASSTLSTSERAAYTNAVEAYVSAFDTIGSNTTWNGTSLMSTPSTMSVQTGVNSGDTTTLTFDKTTTTALEVNDLSLDLADAADAVDTIDTAIDTLNVYQTYIGAMANVMESQSTVATNAITSYSAGYGAIMNADYAAETAKLAAAQIQHDGATAMLIQGNGLNRSLVDYLLGGPSTYAPRTN
jgi:flagellin